MTAEGRMVIVDEPIRPQGVMYRTRAGAAQKPYYGQTGHTGLPCIDLPKPKRS